MPFNRNIAKNTRSTFFLEKREIFDFYNNNTALGKNAIIVLGQKERILQQRGSILHISELSSFLREKRANFAHFLTCVANKGRIISSAFLLFLLMLFLHFPI